MPNISRSKGNQTMKFGQLLNVTREIFSFKNMQKMSQGDYFQTSFCFLKKPNMG